MSQKYKGQIHFNDGQILDYNEVYINYMDNGILTYGEYEEVFIPYSNIKFVRQFKEVKK